MVLFRHKFLKEFFFLFQPLITFLPVDNLHFWVIRIFLTNRYNDAKKLLFEGKTISDLGRI